MWPIVAANFSYNCYKKDCSMTIKCWTNGYSILVSYQFIHTILGIAIEWDEKE